MRCARTFYSFYRSGQSEQLVEAVVMNCVLRWWEHLFEVTGTYLFDQSFCFNHITSLCSDSIFPLVLEYELKHTNKQGQSAEQDYEILMDLVIFLMRNKWGFCSFHQTLFCVQYFGKYSVLESEESLVITLYRGRRVIGISGSLIWSKTSMELKFNPYGEFRWSPEGPVGKSTLLTSSLVPLRSFKVCSDAKERVGCGKQPNLSNPSKTAAWVSELAVEDLPVSRTATLIPEFAVKDLPLARILWWWTLYATSMVKDSCAVRTERR